jgi:hypothetical protein
MTYQLTVIMSELAEQYPFIRFAVGHPLTAPPMLT